MELPSCKVAHGVRQFLFVAIIEDHPPNTAKHPSYGLVFTDGRGQQKWLHGRAADPRKGESSLQAGKLAVKNAHIKTFLFERHVYVALRCENPPVLSYRHRMGSEYLDAYGQHSYYRLRNVQVVYGH